MPVTAASTRWCPTPEQLMVLEEMYRGGMKTPNATQIQQITAHLSHYGKIEGKNVFYWFQNHKARDRQRFRRRLTKQHMVQHHHLQQCQQHQQLLLYRSVEPFRQPLTTTIRNLQHHLFPHFFQPCYTPAASHNHPLHYIHKSSATFLDQAQVQGRCSPQMINYTWKVEIPEEKETEKPVSRSYGDDWMIITDSEPTSTCCSTRPLETLELFPVTATSLKDRAYCSDPNQTS
ncbi:hypothetical protein Nepgr_013055 [Nepenthes gracilis]|uniref:Homeobox domain-containing protein n=1 Tax=Nepenthes gracilis TaxID=150966 RepID=A0AAD3SIC4_NEPGR|nr:hypothetical protein Nepgr_013055 [Nepenthes gracilis]